MDKYLVSLAFLLLFLEAGWLYHDIQNPSFSTHEEYLSDKPLGKILKSRSQVRKKAQDSLIWEETKTEQNLFAYDSVLTMNESTAEIKLQGDSLISMNENTLVVIEPPKDGNADGPLRLRFKKGNLSAKSGRNPQSVETEEYVVEAHPDSKMNIRSTADDKIQIDTLEGEVKLLNPETLSVEKTIQAGESAQVDNKNIYVNKTAQISWNIPIDGQKIYSHLEKAQVEFKWEGKVSGIRISSQEKKEILDISVLNNELNNYKINLPFGNYLAQLESENQFSFARQVSVWPAPKIHLVNPVIRQRFKKNIPIQFLWTQTKDVETYIFELSMDPDFKKLIRQMKTSKMGVEITVSVVGEFYWRVRGVDASGFEIPELYYNNFYVLDKPLDAPKLKAPKVIRDEPTSSLNKFLKWVFNLLIPQAQATDTINNDLSKNYFAEFQWEPVDGAIGYVVEISSSPDFRNVDLTSKVKRESLKWKNFKLGQYYWRVAAVDISGEMGLFSETAYADLNKIPQGPIKPIAPPPVVVKKTELIKEEQTKDIVIQPKQKLASEVDYSYEPWKFKLEIGAHGVYSYQKGEDFNAKMLGLSPFDARFTIMPPEHNYKFWVAEIDLSLLNAKGNPEGQFPFQNKISALTVKGHFIKNNSWGFVLGQYTIFKRADLEALTFNNALAAGVFKQFNSDQRIFRLGLLAGQVFAIETMARQSWDLSKYFDFTAEIKLQGGYSLTKDLYFDFTSQFYFGWSF